jgi:GrpB-like predicted nucleotidyltransferase (UPF0157 family)
MSDPITVVAYDPAWPETFRRLGAQLRAALGGLALRIDHIGSTAVPGLAAKPIVDVQVSVERLEPVEPFRSPLEAAGFLYRAANTERTTRYFREPPGQRRTHVHVRRAGSFSEQFALLFRDFLRADPAATWTMANTRGCWRHGSPMTARLPGCQDPHHLEAAAPR